LKPLPKPLKPPLISYVIAGDQKFTLGLLQNLPEMRIDLQITISDRRCYRNINIYITELPPTPNRFRNKYHQAYEATSLPVQESIFSLQRVGEPPPKGQVLETPLQKDTGLLLLILQSYTTDSQSPTYYGPKVGHGVVMRLADAGLHLKKAPAWIGPVPYRHWDYPRSPRVSSSVVDEEGKILKGRQGSNALSNEAEIGLRLACPFQ